MKQQRGFVVLPVPAATANLPDASIRHGGRWAGWRAALGKARYFGAGLIIGAGIWAPVFAALGDDPGPWGALSALCLFTVAGVLTGLGRIARRR